MNNSFTLFAFILIINFLYGLTAQNPQQCFDALDKLPQNEIENIYFMPFEKVAETQPASDILSCFLRASHPGDKSLIEQYFEVYKKCEEYKRNNFKQFSNQQLEALILLGLPYDLENYLRNTLETGNNKLVEQGVHHVEDVLGKEIELSRDYKDYKISIAKKIRSCEQN